MPKTRIDQAILSRLDLSLEISTSGGGLRHSPWGVAGLYTPAYFTPEKVTRALWKPTSEKLESICQRHLEWARSRGSEGQQADLSNAYLYEADLSDAFLRGADLSGAHLWRADLSEVDLVEADLPDADLKHTDLSRAVLSGADLSEVELAGADLSGATLQDANLSKANLPGVELQGADLWLTDLSGALLSKSDLSGASLRDVNLSKAFLKEADLSEADLLDADLSGATLQDTDLSKAALNDADLQGVEGLQVMQLRGSDVSLADLPDAVREFAGLDTAKATTQSAKKLFISVLIACAYAGLAISLKTGSDETIGLPIVGLEIGTEPFYLVTPGLLALLFGYFHLQMQRLWKELAQLPAIFPDGKPIGEKVHPWLVTGIVRAHVKRLEEKRSPPFFLVQRFVSVLLAWGAVPATLLFFAWMYPPDATAWASLFLFILAALTTSGAIAAYRKATSTLRLEEHHPLRLTRAGADENGVWFLKSKGVWIGVECVLLAFALWYLRLGVPLF